MHRDADAVAAEADAQRREARWNFRRAEKRRRSAREQIAERGPEEETAVHAENTVTDRADKAGGSGAAPPTPRGAKGNDENTPAFPPEEVKRLRGQWRQLQGAFVDDPHAAVRDADELVDEALRTLTARLTARKRHLEGEWDREGPGDTEQLRLTLRRYRAFLNQMLATE